MIIVALILVGFVVAALAYQSIGAFVDRKRFALRGRLVVVNGRRLHVVEQGSGAPGVLLEAGLAASSLSWAYVQPLLAPFARTIAYDRAGLGESEAGPPRSLDSILDDLRGVLDATALSLPYILVGHSFGGLIVRAFAQRRPQSIAGLVLVDPVSIESWGNCSAHDRKRIRVGAMLSRRGARLASFGVVRFAIAAATLRGKHVTRAIARASAGNATPLLGRLAGEIQKLPAALVPIVRAQWSLAKPFRAMAEYLECLPAAASETARLPFPPHIPLIILSAESATAAEIAERNGWMAGRVNARHLILPGTGHWLHLERPDAVAEAVREMISMTRSVRHRIDNVIDPDAETER